LQTDRHSCAIEATLTDAPFLEKLLADTDAAEAEALQPLRLVAFADDQLRAAAADVDHQGRTGRALDVMRYAEIDQARFLHSRDHFDGMAQRLFGRGKKRIGV